MTHHRKTHAELRGMYCSSCSQPFASTTLLEVHSNRHKIFVCVLCRKDFSPRARYNKHIKRRHANLPKQHVCHICLKKFLEGYELRMHLKNHLSVKEKKCPRCPYESNSTTYMNRHIRKHDNDFSFRCVVCNQGFLANNQLKIHMSNKHGDGGTLYPCTVCTKVYASRGNLKEHSKTHEPDYSPDKRHICDLCGKAFIRKHRLKKHMLAHEGVFNFVCMFCQKGFLEKVSMENHIKAWHTLEKTSASLCDVCGKSFTLQRYLTIHLRSHSKEKPYNCDECGKTFTQMSSVTVHKRLHSGERFHCSVCDRGFLTRTVLRTHIRKLSHY